MNGTRVREEKNTLEREMRAGNFIARKKEEVCSDERTSLGRYYYVGSDYYNIKFVQSLGTKRNLILTIDAPDYKAHVPFLRKLKDHKYALWSEKYGTQVIYRPGQSLFL